LTYDRETAALLRTLFAAPGNVAVTAANGTVEHLLGLATTRWYPIQTFEQRKGTIPAPTPPTLDLPDSGLRAPVSAFFGVLGDPVRNVDPIRRLPTDM